MVFSHGNKPSSELGVAPMTMQSPWCHGDLAMVMVPPQTSGPSAFGAQLAQLSPGVNS